MPKKVPFHDPSLPKEEKAPPLEMHWKCQCSRLNYQHYNYCGACGSFKPYTIDKKKGTVLNASD